MIGIGEGSRKFACIHHRGGGKPVHPTGLSILERFSYAMPGMTSGERFFQTFGNDLSSHASFESKPSALALERHGVKPRNRRQLELIHAYREVRDADRPGA